VTETLPRIERQWKALVPDEEWAVYQRALVAARAAKVEFLLGGAFALSVYTNSWRETKDIDLLALPSEKDQIISALNRAGFVDLHDQAPYDRGWIYRAVQDGFIVDVIWQMANRRAEVDAAWFERGPFVLVHGEPLQIVPAEELLWHKLYVLQRDRCDWPDVLNLLVATSDGLDWDWLLGRLGDDALLFKAVLMVFCWICPGRVRRIPERVRREFQLPEPDEAVDCLEERVRFLDSRPWLVAEHSGKMGAGAAAR
jgi:hypothetical protein